MIVGVFERLQSDDSDVAVAEAIEAYTTSFDAECWRFACAAMFAPDTRTVLGWLRARAGSGLEAALRVVVSPLWKRPAAWSGTLAALVAVRRYDSACLILDALGHDEDGSREDRLAARILCERLLDAPSPLEEQTSGHAVVRAWVSRNADALYAPDAWDVIAGGPLASTAHILCGAVESVPDLAYIPMVAARVHLLGEEPHIAAVSTGMESRTPADAFYESLLRRDIPAALDALALVSAQEEYSASSKSPSNTERAFGSASVTFSADGTPSGASDDTAAAAHLCDLLWHISRRTPRPPSETARTASWRAARDALVSRHAQRLAASAWRDAVTYALAVSVAEPRAAAVKAVLCTALLCGVRPRQIADLCNSAAGRRDAHELRRAVRQALSSEAADTLAGARSSSGPAALHLASDALQTYVYAGDQAMVAVCASLVCTLLCATGGVFPGCGQDAGHCCESACGCGACARACITPPCGQDTSSNTEALCFASADRDSVAWHTAARFSARVECALRLWTLLEAVSSGALHEARAALPDAARAVCDDASARLVAGLARDIVRSLPHDAALRLLSFNLSPDLRDQIVSSL